MSLPPARGPSPQQFGEALAARQQPLGGRVEVGAELREGRHLAVLREFALQRPATCFMARICAAEPTRLTEMPTFMAGRTP